MSPRISEPGASERDQLSSMADLLSMPRLEGD